MELSASELAFVRSQRLHITQKCDGCGKLLNQTLRYTILGKPEVYCSAGCRDLTFFGDTREAIKHSTPGKCVYCRAPLEGKRRGAIYCDEICKKRMARAGRSVSTAEPQITRTPTQLNQRVATPKRGGQGDCITSRAQRPRNAPGEVSEESGFPGEKDPWGAEGANLSSVGSFHTPSDEPDQ
jgi:hypothetical protein